MADAKAWQSQWWWFDSDGRNDTTPIRRSPWLNSALAELDEKTKAMLRIIEEDADSFGKRAEMYYKKRPELITMVEDFYRAHRSLAERYDQLKTDPSFRHITPWASSPWSFRNPQKQQQITFSDKSYDSYSETYDDPVEACESDVDDPEEEDQVCQEMVKNKEDVSRGPQNSDDDMAKLREEIERLKEEDRIQKEKLEEKDEEKREVIRHLSRAIDALKEENVKLRKRCVARETPKKASSPSKLDKFKDMFMGKLFMGSPK